MEGQNYVHCILITYMWHRYRVRSDSCVKYWKNRNGLFSVCACSREHTWTCTDHWARCWIATLSGQELINLRENERSEYNGVQNNGRKWVTSCFKWLPDTFRSTLLPSFLCALPDNTAQRWTCFSDGRISVRWDDTSVCIAAMQTRDSSSQTLNTQLCTPKLERGRP